MTTTQAARSILADARATPRERRYALHLLSGIWTPKARDELLVASWREERKGAA
ncbi:MAG: hypothetical protein WBK91_03915 [Alphaproteobacteria bacterium]